MPIFQPRKFLLCAAALLALGGAAAAQDVQSGIAAWQKGDYARAVADWRPLAEAGNADAQFNLAQAYRLGRGVAQNMGLAEQWFERAARQRHEQAGASLGLLLFQNGRAREAMPWIQAAAMRGDPRAQYVFGTALFNGDVLRRDLPRAYAMMSAAAAQGFPQAQAQLGEMERQLTPADRDRGRQIAAEMGRGSGSGTQIAAADPGPALPPALTSRRQPEAGVSYAAPRQPEPGTVPAVPRQQEAVVSAAPSRQPQAGVSYPARAEDGSAASPSTAPAPRAAAPTQRAEAPRARADRPVRQAAPAPAAGGNWRVQLGAFSNEANARRQWTKIRGRVSALGSIQPAFPRVGAITRLRAGAFASRAAADRVCAAVRAAGEDCIAVPR